MIDITVLTSDNYLDALKPFAYLFNKYWSDEQQVNIVGFKTPTFVLPDNFRFISVGNQRDYPLEQWSNALIKYLQSSESAHTIIMLEDYWITRPVNVTAVRILWDYAKQFNYVVRIDLTGDRLYAGGMQPYGYVDCVDLVKSDPASQYHMSLMTAIWNKDLMLKVLIPNETPWQVELEGTPRLRSHGNDMIVLGTRVWPVRHTLAHRRGDPTELLLDEIAPHDREELKKRGWI